MRIYTPEILCSLCILHSAYYTTKPYPEEEKLSQRAFMEIQTPLKEK